MPAMGAYHLDLECDDVRHQGEAAYMLSLPPHSISNPTMFIEATKRLAVREAKKAGWLLLPGSRCVCPLHADHPMHKRRKRGGGGEEPVSAAIDFDAGASRFARQEQTATQAVGHRSQ